MLKQGWKKTYLRAITKWIPLLQPEHGFCQWNGAWLIAGLVMKKWWKNGWNGWLRWKNGDGSRLFDK